MLVIGEEFELILKLIMEVDTMVFNLKGKVAGFFCNLFHESLSFFFHASCNVLKAGFEQTECGSEGVSKLDFDVKQVAS